MNKKDNPVPQLNKDEILLIISALDNVLNRSKDSINLVNKFNNLLKKGVENYNEQPKKYCKAKTELNNPGLPECNCYNFCKFDNIQFDTILG